MGQRGDRPRLLLPSAARTLVAGGARLSARTGTVGSGGLGHSVGAPVAVLAAIVQLPFSDPLARMGAEKLAFCTENEIALLETVGAQFGEEF